ncbi:MAG: winged helix-turn-helix transcriptional regulator [Thermoplasmata archaeon]
MSDEGECRCRECETSENACYCPIEGVINVLSSKYALAIVALVGNHGTIRFNEILGHHGGISPRTLSKRLKELENAGILSRRAFAEIPPRVEYSLTAHGEALRESMKPLLQWVKENESTEE